MLSSKFLAKSSNVLKRSFTLRAQMEDLVPKTQARVKNLVKEHGNKTWDTVKVSQVVGGMRDINCMLYDCSAQDAYDGIKFRGGSIPELCANTPKAEGGSEPLPEGVYWLLMTGNYPTQAELTEFQADLKTREAIPQRTMDLIKSMPKETHPMTMLSMGLMSLQSDSLFAQAYKDGVHKSKYWEVMFEDSLNLLAKLPLLAAHIYRHCYRGSDFLQSNQDLDWAGNYCHMMGYSEHDMQECIRGYQAIHSDHEGGNVSAHTCHLVGSALSDPFLSYSAAVNGLAGPLHGLANQEVLKFQLKLKSEIGDTITHDTISEEVWKILNSGKVVPGYGHAVLRNTDPRYLHQREFAQKHIKNDPLVDLSVKCYEVIPGILKQLGKVKNPFPNVDCGSGVLLNHYGMSEYEYYTVVFAVSRALGCMSNLVWSRALNLPIERPGSTTIEAIEKKFASQ